MTIVYCRDDPVSARWSGLDRLLTEFEVDYNFYQHETRLTAVEAAITVTVSIDTITQPTPTTLLFTMTDSSTQGPFTLPTSTFQDRGEWQSSTAYLVNDTFTANGTLYRVLFDHTSSSGSFDPNANDGAGHDYYAAMLSSPGNSLPTGGSTGMMLKKSSGADYAVSWGFALPNGGTENKVLAKLSNSDQDFGWITLPASAVSFSPATGSVLTATNVADAIEEAALVGSSGGGGSGRKTIYMPAGQMTAMITDGAAPGSVETSVHKNVIKTLDFDATTSEGAQFEIAMPKSWDKGDVSFRAFWSHASASTNFGVVWNIYASTVDPGGDLDGAINNGVLVTSTGGTANTLYVSDETGAITVVGAGTGLTPGDNALLIVQVWRVPPNTDDTLAVDARLQGIQLFYNASAGNDN